MRRARIAHMTLCALVVAGSVTSLPAGAQNLRLNDVCGPQTVLGLVGVDTDAGTALFKIRGDEPGPSIWLLELTAGGRETRLIPDWSTGRRFSGSIGPGPVLAVERCGTGCARVVAWTGEGWRPLGSSLTVSERQSAHLTWDGSGAPWVVLHEAAEQPGRIRVTAYRGAGRSAAETPEATSWEPRGTLIVRAVGSPAVTPDPGSPDAVLTGTGRFSASGEPEGWLAGLPAIPDPRRGQIVPLAPAGAFYLAGDGALYVSDDAGERWRAVSWTPWSDESPSPGSWEHGVDYSLDRPVGSPVGELELVWFDDRVAGAERVVLSLGEADAWRVAATFPPALEIGGRGHPLEHILRLGDSWLMLGGCAGPGEGAGLVLRTVREGAVSTPRLAPFVPSWLAE